MTQLPGGDPSPPPSCPPPSPLPLPTLAALGWDDGWRALAAEPAVPSDPSATSTVVPARVLRHDGVAVLVGGDTGVGRAHLRATTPPLAVGDWVLVDTDDDVVVALLPRRSRLARRDPTTGDEQLLAANVDVVGIVCGLDRRVRPGRLERVVTLAWDAGAVPLVVLTKQDQAGDLSAARAAATDGAPGVEVIEVSAVDGTGLDRLRATLANRTVAFVGESGAGKSTLVNALARREVAATGAVRHGDHKGRHTTTARQLHLLPDDCRLIDTPGLREVGLWTDVATVDDAFGDLTALAEGCRFADCAHDTEPGCAVIAAVERGELRAERLASWARQRREAAAAELRADPVAAHRAARRFGRMTREAQKIARRRR